MMRGRGTVTPEVIIRKIEVSNVPDIHVRPIVPVLGGQEWWQSTAIGSTIRLGVVQLLAKGG